MSAPALPSLTASADRHGPRIKTKQPAAGNAPAQEGEHDWHEIIHGILEDRRLQLDEDVEESVCEALSRGIYQVLQDNARSEERR